MINLWQLRVFLEVAETGSFSAAAVRLHMTQPGVSQQIRTLESHLGTSLFVRRGHGVELTAAGFDLQDPARRMINLSETTERALMSRRGEVSGRIRLGCAISSGPLVVTQLLQEFRGLHPDVTIQIEHAEPGPMLSSLRAQEMDGGLVLGRMRGRGLVHHRLAEDPVTLIVPLSHPWTSPAELSRAEAEYSAKREGLPPEGHTRVPRHEEEGWVPAVKPAMLKDQPIVLEHGLGESHSDARRALSDALEERGISARDLTVAVEMPDAVSVASAVAEGMGIGLVPLSIARRFVGQVVPVRIEGFALVQHVYMIRDRKALNSQAVAAWWKFVESRIQQSAEDRADGSDTSGSESKASVAKLETLASATQNELVARR